ISAGFTVYMDRGYLKAEYNAMTLNRYKVKSNKKVTAGKHQLEVIFKAKDKKRMAPATMTLLVDGKEVGTAEVGRTVPAVFTASETFDVGLDLMSPVSLDYYDRAPFKFNGKIEKINVKYID
ncbi:MAG: arylsulfatase, partial [Chlorobi bacterium]|nr:arylsulfatase [Chlorobiota bacterium]